LKLEELMQDCRPGTWNAEAGELSVGYQTRLKRENLSPLKMDTVLSEKHVLYGMPPSIFPLVLIT
jgi:hypothetical protein